MRKALPAGRCFKILAGIERPLTRFAPGGMSRRLFKDVKIVS
jgi:hypothetical protein